MSLVVPTIPAAPPEIDPVYLHAVLAQLGLPRSPTKERRFQRRNGSAIVVVEAGELFDGREMVQQPLPSGTRPRLVLLHCCTEAIRTKSPVIEIGNSVRGFLRLLDIDAGGKAMGYFRREMMALAACRLTLGIPGANGPRTVAASPISQFEAWLAVEEGQQVMWPGMLELSTPFFDSLREHAVPLDPNGIRALQNSALALDVYTWLAHRLCRIRSDEGVRLSWANRHAQFGQEYSSQKRFREKFLVALRAVHAAYPDAKIEQGRGCLVLKPSPPPIARVRVVVALPVQLDAQVATTAASPTPAPRPAALPQFVTEDGLNAVRTVAPGWDRQQLLLRWTEWQRGKPAPKNFDAAFLGWAKKFTKGKPPT